jgi:hypothetical protein
MKLIHFSVSFNHHCSCVVDFLLLVFVLCGAAWYGSRVRVYLCFIAKKLRGLSQQANYTERPAIVGEVSANFRG